MKLKLEKPELLKLDPKFAPPNADPKAVARLVRNYNSHMKSQMATALEAAQREVDTADELFDPGLFTVDQRKADALARKARKQAEALAAEKAPTAATLTGHNPNFFAPFFSGGRSSTVGGAVTTARFIQNAAAGTISISVSAVLPGGHISRAASMGALSLAPSTRLVTASMSTFVGGAITAATILGYGRASASIFVSVLADGPGGFRSATGTLSLGAISLGRITVGSPLTNMTVSTPLMVRAGDLLLISGGMSVTAGCGGIICFGVSNIAISGTVLCLL